MSITFILSRSFERSAPLELITAIKKVEYTLNTLRADIDLLPIVNFDPLYTKPVNLTSVDIVGKAVEESIVVTLDTYTQKYLAYKFFRVLSMVQLERPDTIQFNTRVFNSQMSSNEWVANIFHELTHVWDAHSPYRFDHGDNNLKGKDNSAPVKLSKILQSVCIGLNETRPVEALLW